MTNKKYERKLILMQTNSITFRPNIKGVIFKNVEIIENTYHFFCEREDEREICCDRPMNIHDYRNVSIKSLSYGGMKVIIHIRKQRYCCPVCKNRVTSDIESVEKNCFISLETKKEIERLFGDMKSFKQIAKETNVSISTVMRIFDDYEVAVPEYDYSVIFFDEFKGNADKEKFQVAVYDKNKKLIKILKNRKIKGLKDFFKEHKEKIELVNIDMFMQFRNAIKSELPKAEIIADKFHVVRQVSWMIRDLRVRLFNSDKEKYKDLKKYWKLIMKNHTKGLTEKQEYRMEELVKLNDEFKIGYGLKSGFLELINTKDHEKFEKELENLIVELKETEIKECLKLSETLENWKTEIVNSIKYGYNNGFVEGLNNKIKVIKRVSYGIKKFENLEKLIQIRIGA